MRALKILLIAVLCCSLTQAQNVIIPGQSAAIMVADLDGDGNMEVTNSAISCGFADFDNYGLPDYYTFGNGADNAGTIFVQNPDGTFTKDQSSFTGMNMLDADVTIVDFNNDGYIDLFVSGWDNNTQQRYSAIYQNNGKGKFAVSPQPGLIAKGYGSSVWGDVDGDGWLDLLLNGDGGANGEASNDIYRLYRNNKGVLESKSIFHDFRQISVGDGARMVDWDNDGKLDIILTGWSNTKNRQATMLYTCTDKTNFTFTESVLSNTDFPGVSESSIETADLNNDGRIDLLISGYNGNQPTQIGKYNRNIFGYYLNQSPVFQVKPGACSGLTQVVGNNGDQTIVTLSWNAATDDKTPQASLTYNLSLRNKTTGKWLYNPMAVMSGTTNGWRRVAAMGNVFTNRKWVLSNLPEGIYEWTVQAIDANFAGGMFVTAKSFTISSTEVKELVSNVSISGGNGRLRIANSDANEVNISVFNVTGNLIKQLTVEGSSSVSLAPGVYIVKASDDVRSVIRKVLL